MKHEKHVTRKTHAKKKTKKKKKLRQKELMEKLWLQYSVNKYSNHIESFTRFHYQLKCCDNPLYQGFTLTLTLIFISFIFWTEIDQVPCTN